jgi:hypothetical protein
VLQMTLLLTAVLSLIVDCSVRSVMLLLNLCHSSFVPSFKSAVKRPKDLADAIQVNSRVTTRKSVKHRKKV